MPAVMMWRWIINDRHFTDTFKTLKSRLNDWMSEIRHFDTSFIEMLCARERGCSCGCCGLMFCCFGVCLRKSARSAGDFWGFICANRLSKLACYSPADHADDADECSKLHYFADKDRLGWLMLFCCYLKFVVLWFVCDYQRDLREIYWVSSMWINWVRLRIILPQMAQITQTNAAICIISQRKTDWGGSCCFVVLGFVCDYLRYNIHLGLLNSFAWSSDM